MIGAKPRRWASGLLLVFFGALGGLVLAEGALRLAGHGYRLYRLGTAGLLGGGAAARVVLCVGDSFTFGVGAEKGQSYPEQLEKLLNAKQAGAYKVHNEGRPGMNSSQLLDRLETWLRRHRPEAVVVLVGANNYDNWVDSNYGLFLKPEGRWASLKRLRLYRVALRAWRQREARLTMRRLERGRTFVPWSQAQSQRYQALMSDYRRHIGRRDVRAAEASLRLAIKEFPEEPATRFWLAWSVLARGKPSPESLREGLDMAEKLIELSPNSHDPEHPKQEMLEHGLQLRLMIRRHSGLEPLPQMDLLDRLLRHDLTEIVRRVESYGARAVVLNYPGGEGMTTNVRAPLCRELGCAFVNVSERFDRLFDAAKPCEYLSCDNPGVRYSHPNGKGYAMLAGAVAEALVAPSRPAQASSRPTVGKAGIEWVEIPGGSFMMGSRDGDAGGEEKPAHKVAVRTFQMAKTPVTFGQYRRCVAAGVCAPAHTSDGTCLVYNGRRWTAGALPASFQGDEQPVVCVDWDEARKFAVWAEARLPTEAEWEFAARGGGQDRSYPWGDAKPTCDRAVMQDGKLGCGRSATWPVCSKSAGHTEQGLCDMAGNVWTWTQDRYHDTYAGAPADGSAWEAEPGAYRVIRGGSWRHGAKRLRITARDYGGPGPHPRCDYAGIRVAR